MNIEIGERPTLESALESIHRVGAMIGGDGAARWARELRLIATRLSEGSRWGPRGIVWAGEAARLQLAADVAEYGFNRRRAVMTGKALAAELPGLEAKASNAADRLELAAIRLRLEAAVAEEVEQIELDPRDPFDGGKAMAGMSREKERSLKRFIEDIGGFAPSGYAADVLDFDDHHFERAMLLIRGEVEPESDDETKALARWQENERRELTAHLEAAGLPLWWLGLFIRYNAASIEQWLRGDMEFDHPAEAQLSLINDVLRDVRNAVGSGAA